MATELGQENHSTEAMTVKNPSSLTDEQIERLKMMLDRSNSVISHMNRVYRETSSSPIASFENAINHNKSSKHYYTSISPNRPSIACNIYKSNGNMPLRRKSQSVKKFVKIKSNRNINPWWLKDNTQIKVLPDIYCKL